MAYMEIPEFFCCQIRICKEIEGQGSTFFNPIYLQDIYKCRMKQVLGHL
ncbi:hypothetical protein ACJIZ3_022164 [Penstemon smallii]|uniref:Uncharacterized protein n=1 Tax=Penstemon smallii TaxID=265156 RepID=A0ABD3SP31_9LAMI